MSIYVTNGAPGAGKTTFEENVKAIVGDSCYILSTITPIKEVAKTLGWNGAKDLKNRKFLSDLKDLLTKYNDYSFNYICNKVEEIQSEYYGFSNFPTVFIDCREPQEIKRLCDTLGAKSLLIRRASAENSETSNHADAEVLNYNYDIIIENDGDLRDLALTAFDFVEGEKLYKQPNLTVDMFGEITKEK